MKRVLLFLLISSTTYIGIAQQKDCYVSKVWNADLGNGYYKNPIIYADYADPDVCRVGDDYYMTAASYNSIPGLPILHSKDLVSWKLVGHVIKKLPQEEYNKPRHGDGVWSPTIRYHNNEFYIYYSDPDYGIYMTKAAKVDGPWETPILIMKGRGLIGPCPFWDGDGSAYLIHAYSGSKYGIKSLLSVCKMSADGKSILSDDVVVYDGHGIDETIEGPKLYKRNGYYYIFAPAGGVPTGWQVVLRSKNIYGPYERRVVLVTGDTKINGPHQGAWIDTKSGEDWFIHYQEKPAAGRVLHLQPVRWEKDWPLVGEKQDKEGTGQPVAQYKKPNVGKYPICNIPESDEFNGDRVGLQWQWTSNPKMWWAMPRPQEGVLRLYSVPVVPEGNKNLWSVDNLFLQKFPAPEFSITTKISFTPNKRMYNERAGLVIMGFSYAHISIENTPHGFTLSQIECMNADKGTEEKINATVNLEQNRSLYLRAKVADGDQTTFFYSLNGKDYEQLGTTFTAKSGRWMGTRMGLFITRPKQLNDGGWIDVDFFRVDK